MCQVWEHLITFYRIKSCYWILWIRRKCYSNCLCSLITIKMESSVLFLKRTRILGVVCMLKIVTHWSTSVPFPFPFLLLRHRAQWVPVGTTNGPTDLLYSQQWNYELIYIYIYIYFRKYNGCIWTIINLCIQELLLWIKKKTVDVCCHIQNNYLMKIE